MSSKVEPIGICDHCGDPIPRGEWRTSHGRPRRFCSVDCRNTANSRAGALIRSVKAKKRVAAGVWKNPRSFLSVKENRELNVNAARKGRQREIAEGRWRNPALDDAAREKLSRPRTVTDPLVHRAIELMRQGMKLRELPAELRNAYNAYSREYEREHRDEIRARQRAAYKKRRAHRVCD